MSPSVQGWETITRGHGTLSHLQHIATHVMMGMCYCLHISQIFTHHISKKIYILTRNAIILSGTYQSILRQLCQLSELCITQVHINTAK